MLSIGIKLSLDDFALAVKRPLPLSVGLIVQYMLKSGFGVLIAKAFGMSPMFYASFILTSYVAGAKSSSYATFLSKGDVVVSILLTSFTTIASVFLTPLLTGLLIGSVVPVDALSCTESESNYIKRWSPIGSSGFGISRCGIRYQILDIEYSFFQAREEVCRTVSLCSGMQSSTMAGLLAIQFLGGNSQAVPVACSVIAMSIMGLSLTSFWGSGYRLYLPHKLGLLFRRLNESKTRNMFLELRTESKLKFRHKTV
ncbi:hypothetical protein GOBAR_AA26078 [Gossypium barbadense]|uniref:Uncharacterized protein n=1 Tax=Gossypium barbadense TaxID=3634 RepID=A0A2P5WU35_GOSBA|nr:hypothetical protein GOBAR_AA26078 [Gossypium barbadense]